ncbi:Aste57867_12771 [Aphanomyces stellatus]|uniref:Aste57867_12771 protein n=1 Tax=Aphanomyces stellatus TaxID=120398 RepID=A0A485KWG2_9STRA|nr:hypothetical protein As57867_012723 [Aphanomyces stellatus]VFT89620.1 Aste57867_12771 [Aphanomyces stellatus]
MKVLFASMFLVLVVDACTMIAIGKKATVDGSTIVTHNDDAGGETADLRLVATPRQTHEPFTQRPVFKLAGGYPRVVSAKRNVAYAPVGDQNETRPLGFIPQVTNTYGYIAQEYAIVNEVQLSIGESTCNAKTTGWPTSIPGGKAVFGLGELTSIALERCDNARCAIQLMGQLATDQGFYSEYGGTPDAPGYDSEALGITDRYGEVWVFHILAGPGGVGAIWAAQRVPDNHVAVVANHFTIGLMDLSDPDWYLASDNVISAAIANGWYTPQDNATYADFNFKNAYAKAPPPATAGPVLYADGRSWRIYNRFAPSRAVPATFGYVDAYPEYPFSVAVDAPISLDNVTSLLRDQYQGTEYDLTQGLAAGPFESPLRYSGYTAGVHGAWINPISVHRTLYSYVAQARPASAARPDALAGTLWFGQSAPHGTVYVPFSCAQSTLPASFDQGAGKQSEFTHGSAWWAFNFVNNWRTLRYNLIGSDVDSFNTKYQEEAYALVERRDRRDEDGLAVRNLDGLHNGFADRVVAARWTLAWKLIGKYSDGYVTPDEGPMESPGYPAWWLNETNYVQWGEKPAAKATPMQLSSPSDRTPFGGTMVSLLCGFVMGFIAHVLFQSRRRYDYLPLP